MLALLSLILALLLTAAIVIVLHRFQENSRANAADREQGLPPLQLDSKENPDPAPVTEPAETAEQPQQKEASEKAEAGPAEQIRDKIDSTIISHTEPEVTESPSPVPPADWKQQSQQQKESGEYETALLTCQLAWPQWQSYQQAAIIMRAAIRVADSDDSGQWLERLYHLAAEAGFLHDKVDGLPQLNWQTLARQFTPAALSVMHFDWHELGYQNMRLLTKTDIRQMTAAWGEPATHRSPKLHYQKVFMSQSAY